MFSITSFFGTHEPGLIVMRHNLGCISKCCNLGEKFEFACSSSIPGEATLVGAREVFFENIPG